MKKIVLFFIFSVLFTVNANAGFYGSIKVGYSFVQGEYKEDGYATLNTNDNTLNGLFAVGYGIDFSKMGLRFEFEYNVYDKVKSEKNIIGYVGDYYTLYPVYAHMEGQQHSVAANVYLDIKTSTIITPYIGAGVGLSIVDVMFVGHFPGYKIYTSDDVLGPSIQVMLGVGVILHKYITLDIGYKLHYAFDLNNTKNSTSIGEFNMLSNNIFAGLRFTF